jgi:hypothetical protein
MSKLTALTFIGRPPAALSLTGRPGLLLLLALQILHRFHQRAKNRPSRRAWNQQRAGWALLLVRTHRHAVNADEAGGDRNDADSINENLGHENYP